MQKNRILVSGKIVTGHPDVICLGILVADFFPNPIERIPNPGELARIDSITLSTGGCAANTSVALAKLGIRTGVVGRVGGDEFGGFIKRDLEKQGIDTSRMVTAAEQETSKTIILSVEGEDRRYLHLFGANKGFRLSDVDIAYLKGAKVLYVGGFLGIPDFTVNDTVDLFSELRREGVKTVLDVIAPEYGDHRFDFTKLLPHVDVFLPNSDEGELLTGAKSVEAQAAIFAEMGARAVVITMGGGGFFARTEKSLIRAGAFSMPYIDGSGAGDAFDAGFIYSMLKGESIEESLIKASAMGASCVRALGCSPGLFTRDELEEFCENQVHAMQSDSLD